VSDRPTRVAVLVSGTGTNLQALLDACSDNDYGVRIVAVGADRDGAEGLVRARHAGIPTFVDPITGHPDRDAWDRSLTEAVAAYDPAFVVCAGFMKLLGRCFLDRFTAVNTHPALLPAFPGAHAVRAALAYGVKLTGCTVHLVDDGVDTGPIIAQRAVPVLDGDDEVAVRERIKTVERELLVDVVGGMAREGWLSTGRKVRIGQ